MKRGYEEHQPCGVKGRKTVKANKSWGDEIMKRDKGKKTFSCPREGMRPRIRKDICQASKGIASKFYQLASSQAWLAPSKKGLGGPTQTYVGGVDRSDGPGNIVLRNA